VAGLTGVIPAFWEGILEVGKGEGPFPRHGGGTEQRSETSPRKTNGFQTFKMLQVALYHALGNLPESEFTHEFF
jgi:hypothetical protein